MSKAKFSNGPWKIDESYQSMFLITDSLGAAVTEVDSAGFYSGVYNEWTVSPTDTQKANAHLIAAAPEMYELLEKLVNPDNCKKDIIHIIGNAESLLAKARGEL